MEDQKHDKKIVALGLIAVMCLGVLTACNSNKIVETDYFRVELNKKDGYAIVLELTELGKEQEILAIPMFVENLPVKQIGRHNKMFGPPYAIESVNLKKIYISHSVETIYKGTTFATNNEIIYNWTDIPNNYFVNIVSPTRGIAVIIHDDLTLTKVPNVAFVYNYPNSPNHGYYWFDYIIGTNQYLMPLNPTRQNNTFAGWYLEPELITPWNEQMPQSAEETLNLYAKWQKK